MFVGEGVGFGVGVQGLSQQDVESGEGSVGFHRTMLRLGHQFGWRGVEGGVCMLVRRGGAG